MEWDLILRIIYFLLGGLAVLAFGTVVWNARLIYYWLWCRFTYGSQKNYYFRRKS